VTLFATQHGRTVKVTCTYGPVTFEVAEDPQHLRSFWASLGQALDAAEHEARNATHEARIRSLEQHRDSAGQERAVMKADAGLSEEAPRHAARS
jgi:hypothetical protein